MSEPNDSRKTPIARLFAAIARNDNVTIGKILSGHQSLDVNARNQEGNTLLHTAIIEANPDMVALLIAFGADVNAGDKQGVTPLQYAVGGFSLIHEIRSAAERGRTSERLYACAEKLLKGGANPDLWAKPDEPPLHAAINCLRPDVVALLLLHGADPNIEGINGQRSLQCTAVGHGLDAPQYSAHDAQQAARERLYACLDMLLNGGCDPNSEEAFSVSPDPDDKAAEPAAPAGESAHLFDDLPEPTCFRPLHSVMVYGSNKNVERWVQRLLEAGADPRMPMRDGRTAIDLAKKLKNKAVLTLLRNRAREMDRREGKPGLQIAPPPPGPANE